MSLTPRRPVSLGRSARQQRDDRCFVVAAEDTDAPDQYFRALSFNRVKVVVLPTPRDSGESAPRHVVERLRDAFAEATRRGEVQDGDEFWVFLDTDHRTQGTHLTGTSEALRDARHSRFNVAFSNPCFELWLLLHLRTVSTVESFENCGAVAAQIRAQLGSYNKTSIHPGQFTVAQIPEAITRAKALDQTPDHRWPEKTGTQVYRLLERVLQIGGGR